jgi:hypothetical protein
MISYNDRPSRRGKCKVSGYYHPAIGRTLKVLVGLAEFADQVTQGIAIATSVPTLDERRLPLIAAHWNWREAQPVELHGVERERAIVPNLFMLLREANKFNIIRSKSRCAIKGTLW